MSDPQHHTGASSESATFFPRASGMTINGGSFVGTYVAAPDNIYRYLEPMYKLVAQNGILNQGGRADEVRCHPGTREEVIAKIEKWRDGGYLLDRLIFWLSGPAGAGKSAIMQTVAEQCIKEGIPMINFFFFRADGTRNHAGSLIPTILFQLFNIFPALKAFISTIIRENPLVFTASLPNQFRTLIIDPILHLQRVSPSERRVLLLIDGLDECNAKADQSVILRILHEVVTLPNSPFIALVASRAESHIIMTFNSIGTFHGSIFLDDSYRPDEDIRTYIRAQLVDIKRTHPLRHTLGPEWPKEGDIDAIVRKSSGQFIYAATVVRFVSDHSSSPAAGMKTVLGIRPAGNRTPFAEIDALYTHILSQVNDWHMVRGAILLATTALRIRESSMASLLGCGIDDIESSFLVLAPIVHLGRKYSPDIYHLRLYHASFNDFLHDRTRAGNFYMDKDAVARPILQRLITSRNFGEQDMFHELHTDLLLRQIKIPTAELTLALQEITLVKRPLNFYVNPGAKLHCIHILCRIYDIYDKVSDVVTGMAIVRSWMACFQKVGIDREDIAIPLSAIPKAVTAILVELWPEEPPQPERCSSPARGGPANITASEVSTPHTASAELPLARALRDNTSPRLSNSPSLAATAQEPTRASTGKRRKWRIRFWKGHE